MQQIGGAWQAAGWLGAASAIVMLLVRFVRTPLGQTILIAISPSLSWDKWPRWLCWLFISVTSFAVSLLANLGAHMPWVQAVASAMPDTFKALVELATAGGATAVGAVVLHKATQAAGSALTEEGGMSVSIPRNAVSAVLPVDVAKLQRMTSIKTSGPEIQR
jgi:hypothetical protein